MKLLYDENLPPDFVWRLADLFPHSASVRRLEPRPTSDYSIWLHARDHGFAIISKDSDFVQLAFRFGHPPKAIWLRCGNLGLVELERFVRLHASAIDKFLLTSDESLLALP